MQFSGDKKDTNEAEIESSDSNVVYALTHFEVNINLIPLSIFNAFRLGKLRPCFVVLQMANRIRMHLEGIIKMSSLRLVGSLLILTLFFLIMMQKTGMSLLGIRRRTDRCKRGTLNMRLDEEEMVLKVYKPLNPLSNYKYLCMIMAMGVDECGVVE